MALLGMGMGLVMPVMNIAVQNEFDYRDLGVATSAVQLFRGLGSTVGIAIFGALLTAGLTNHMAGVEQSKFITLLQQNPAVERSFGSFDDVNTLLTLNMPDPQAIIRDQALQQIDDAPMPEEVRQQKRTEFLQAQAEYHQQVTEAFSQSLQTIFAISALLMAPAIALVFVMRERELQSASPDITPGEI